MSKFSLASALVAIVSLLLITACAEESTDAKSAAPATTASKTDKTKKAVNKVVDTGGPTAVQKNDGQNSVPSKKQAHVR